MLKTTLEIEGMMCEGCVRMVDRTLKSLPGVEKVDVSLKKKEAVLKVAEPLSAGVYQKTLEDAGYRFEGLEG